MEKMNNFIKAPTRAVAPRFPCSTPHCKICDSHSHQQGDVKLDMPTPKPSLWEKWMAMSIGGDEMSLPHLSFIATPERIR